jgi:general secretion pathway protein H
MSSADWKAGFTLIEIVAVMSIIALVAALVIAATPGTGRSRLKAVALETASMLRRQRVSAILSGRTRLVWLDGERRGLVAEGGDRVAIPNDVALDMLGVDALWVGRRAVARFDPDGSSSGAVLKYSREGAGYEIRVNWYTGAVAVIAAQP